MLDSDVIVSGVDWVILAVRLAFEEVVPLDVKVT